MTRQSFQQDSLRSPDLDLSRLNEQELGQLRDAIIERARKSVDPNGTGFAPTMEGTDDGTMFSTDDGVLFRDWWEWVELVARRISEASVRIGLAALAAGGALASAHMFASEAGARFALPTLVVSGLFAVWFVVSAARAATRGR